MTPEITAHIANLGKYNAGTLTDAVLTFPTTTEQVQAALRSIGVDGLRYEEIIITEYSSGVPGLAASLGEYAHLDELNYLAARMSVLAPGQLEKFAAAVCHGEYGGNLQDLINLTYNLDCYDLLPEVKTYEDYGRLLVDTHREFHLSPKAQYYFDFAAYGEDTAINEGGELTPQGYICNNRSPFQKVYDALNIPQEYRVFQYPMQAKARERPPEHPPAAPTR